MLKSKYTSLLLMSSIFFALLSACQQKSEGKSSDSVVAIKERVIPKHKKTIVEVLEQAPVEDFAELEQNDIPVIEPSHHDFSPDSNSDASSLPPPVIPLPPPPVPAAEVDEAECGNQRQEVLSLEDNPCPHEFYGTTVDAINGKSQLLFFNLKTGDSFNLGLITQMTEVRAIEFDWKGQLYAVGTNNSTFKNVLATINCFTNEAEIIGNTMIENLPGNLSGPSEFISDLNFDPNGRLWAFLEKQKTVGTINILTGEFTPLPSTTGIPKGVGDGLASLPFPKGDLFHADRDKVSLINPITGLSKPGPILSFPVDLTASTYINAMEADWIDDTVYVSFVDKPLNFFGVIDIDTGIVNFIDTDQINGPEGLDGIAFNHRYERCEIGLSVPPNTVCDKQCELRETRCDNGIDDDFDGLTDCVDLDCNNLSCNDGDACTINENCVSQKLACVASAFKDCSDHRKCTDDLCNSETGECTHVINREKNVFGSCANEGDGCLAGRCEESKGMIICTEIARVDIPVNDPLDPNGLSCDDENSCTSDACSVGNCTHLRLPVNTACMVDNNPCEPGVCSTEGVCISMTTPRGPSAVPCETGLAGLCNDGHFLCLDGRITSRCIPDQAEVSLGEICTNNIDDDCNGKTDCADPACEEGTLCDDQIPCTPTSTCWGGMCMGVAPPETLCVDGLDNDCDHAIDCVDSDCKNAVCDDGNACSVDDRCRAGRCFGVPISPDFETQSNTCVGVGGCCNNGIDDDCDGLIDCADFSCRTDTEICHNGEDDNCNGQIDCADIFCKTSLAFVPENCSNGIDDNCNGKIDCQEASCLAAAEICNNGADDNCNGLIDCEETSCQTGAEICHNGVDDNCNMLIDCAEPSCQSGNEICTNGVDDNCNLLIDCAELTCHAAPEICMNNLDDNCNGLIDENCTKLVFVSAGSFNPATGTGVNGANQLCQSEAMTAGKTGTFLAWISNEVGFSPNASFIHATIPYRLADGHTIIANNYADLTDGTLLNPISQDINGDPVDLAHLFVWTGTTELGNPIPGQTCLNWTASGFNNGAKGFTGATDQTWSESVVSICALISPLYCFEQ